MRSDKTFAFAPAIDKTVYDSLFAGYAPVIYGNRETFALHIERQVLAHHGKPDQSYICFHIFSCFYVEFYLRNILFNLIVPNEHLFIALFSLWKSVISHKL